MTYCKDDLYPSPKTSYTYDGPFQMMRSRNITRPSRQNEDIVQQLENFKFPKAYGITTKPKSSGCEGLEKQNEEQVPVSPTQISTEGFRRVSSGSMMSNTVQIPISQRPRRFSHRRSEAVSGASSDDSLFSNLCSTTKTLTRDTSIFSNHSTKTNTPTRLEFEELSISKKPSRIQTANTTTTATTAKQPLIDLDVASKPLQPRLASPTSIQTFPQQSEAVKFNFQDDTSISEKEEEDAEEKEQEEEGGKDEENMSVFDFLKESINESSQVVSENYNPFQYIHLNRSWWIQS